MTGLDGETVWVQPLTPARGRRAAGRRLLIFCLVIGVSVAVVFGGLILLVAAVIHSPRIGIAAALALLALILLVNVHPVRMARRR